MITLFRVLPFIFFFVSLKPIKSPFVLVYPPFFISGTSKFWTSREKIMLMVERG